MLLVGGGAKVADFGLAKFMERSLATNSGAMTPAYAAPEFFNGQTTSTSDQYALAVSYCQLCGGQLPFTGTVAQIVAGHLKHPPDLSKVPEEERPAVARALSKEPGDRFPDCRSFVQALALAARNEPPLVPSPALKPPAPVRKLAWARRLGLWLLAASLLVAITVLAWVLLQGPDPLAQPAGSGDRARGGQSPIGTTCDDRPPPE